LPPSYKLHFLIFSGNSVLCLIVVLISWFQCFFLRVYLVSVLQFQWCFIFKLFFTSVYVFPFFVVASISFVKQIYKFKLAFTSWNRLWHKVYEPSQQEICSFKSHVLWKKVYAITVIFAHVFCLNNLPHSYCLSYPEVESQAFHLSLYPPPHPVETGKGFVVIFQLGKDLLLFSILSISAEMRIYIGKTHNISCNLFL